MVVFATTEHLNLRAYRESDLDLLLALWNDPRVLRTLTTNYVVPQSPRFGKEVLADDAEKSLLYVVLEAKEVDEGEDGLQGEGDKDRWAEDAKWVGFCALSMRITKNRDARLSIALLPRWWGRGFGTEAVRWIVDYGFETLGLHRISLGVMRANEAAISLYKKGGFKVEGRRRDAIWFEGGWTDDVSMGILEDEWSEERDKRPKTQTPS